MFWRNVLLQSSRWKGKSSNEPATLSNSNPLFAVSCLAYLSTVENGGCKFLRTIAAHLSDCTASILHNHHTNSAPCSDRCTGKGRTHWLSSISLKLIGPRGGEGVSDRPCCRLAEPGTSVWPVTQFPQNAARGKVQDRIPTAAGSDGVQTGPEAVSHTIYFSDTHFNNIFSWTATLLWRICPGSVEGGILGKPTGFTS
jgi:hypothetical protein